MKKLEIKEWYKDILVPYFLPFFLNLFQFHYSKISFDFDRVFLYQIRSRNYLLVY
jgi:hypothetical protein